MSEGPLATQAISDRRLAYRFFLEFKVSVICRSRGSLKDLASRFGSSFGSVGIYGTCRISITGFDNIIIAREARVGAHAGFATVLAARVGAQAGFATVLVARVGARAGFVGTALAARLGVGFVLAFQGGVTYILTVGRSATGVKLKVNGQGLQKLSSHRSNKKLHGQETKRKL